MSALKTCTKCCFEKPLTEFYSQGASRYRAMCKLCYASYNRQQHEKHIEKRIAYDAARGSGWERSGREKYKPPEPIKWAKHIQRTYGLSVSEFDAMFAAQGGVCAICRQECNRSSSTRLCVDHNHATAKVRGLLCFQCNVGLGKFKDTPSLLRTAADYIEMADL